MSGGDRKTLSYSFSIVSEGTVSGWKECQLVSHRVSPGQYSRTGLNPENRGTASSLPGDISQPRSLTQVRRQECHARVSWVSPGDSFETGILPVTGGRHQGPRGHLGGQEQQGMRCLKSLCHLRDVSRRHSWCLSPGTAVGERVWTVCPTDTPGPSSSLTLRPQHSQASSRTQELTPGERRGGVW